MRAARLALPLAALLPLAACDYFGGAEEAPGEATGEVLTGSVSDAMIPTDDLKSQPPALKVQPGEGGVDGADSADSAAVDSAVVDGEAPVAEDAAPTGAVAE